MMLWIALIGTLLLITVGVPVAMAMGLSGILAAVIAGNEPLIFVLKRLVLDLDSFPLLACPFFIFAGELMSNGGISKRIVQFSNSAVGFVRGGMGMVSVLASMIFAGISGSATADASAIGSIMIPQLTEKNYPRGFSAALVACAGSIGMIIPPSLAMIVYGSLASESIGKLFLGGLVPGILFGVGMMIIVFIYVTKWGWKGSGRFNIREILAAGWKAAFALLMPIIIIAGIIFGIFTATEAGIVASVYGLIIGAFVYRELTWKKIYDALLSAVVVTGYVMFTIAAAGVLSHILTISHVPDHLVTFISTISSNRNVILLVILGAVLLAGFYLEMFPMLMLLVPILVPVVKQFGFDPIHFGVLFCISIVMGGVTPPVGGLLFVAMGISKATMSEVNRYIFPFIAIMTAVIILGVFFPSLVTFVPNLLFAK